MCDRCKLHQATLIHMFWDCPKLLDYWKFDMLSRTTDEHLEPSAFLALFGVVTQNFVLNNNKLRLLSFATLIARRQILIRWKECNPPTFAQWVRDMLYFIKLEKIRYSVKESADKLMLIWQPFLSRLDALAPDDFMAE